ncbi:hypothetical protein ASC94_07045 [Massilia sp. Root418]|jgi:hypothetical protein|uniref:hypothetical protein n=1 Tax=Massilia sp. Root418 TaxID=1736532 RepID=UPI0007017100|nr:hypothetical protein [Massilia sp. Root418]KQW96593.1 hypothetical protein ASC94_07045 [Massilia sp. Root418]
MSESIYLLTICLPLGAAVIIFGMKYFSAAFAARARAESDAAYSALAGKAVQAQAAQQATLAAMQAEIARLSGSVASVEKILKQVE